MQDCLLVDTEWQSCSVAWQQLLLGSFWRTDGSIGAVCLLTPSSSQLSQHSLLLLLLLIVICLSITESVIGSIILQTVCGREEGYLFKAT